MWVKGLAPFVELEECSTPISANRPCFANDRPRKHLSILSNSNIGADPKTTEIEVSGDNTFLLVQCLDIINKSIAEGVMPLDKRLTNVKQLPDAMREIVSCADSSTKMAHLRKKL
jgi:hypothetical protein